MSPLAEQGGGLGETFAQSTGQVHLIRRASMTDAQCGGDFGCGAVPTITGPQRARIYLTLIAVVVAAAPVYQFGDRRQPQGRRRGLRACPTLDRRDDSGVISGGKRSQIRQRFEHVFEYKAGVRPR